MVEREGDKKDRVCGPGMWAVPSCADKHYYPKCLSFAVGNKVRRTAEVQWIYSPQKCRNVIFFCSFDKKECWRGTRSSQIQV